MRIIILSSILLITTISFIVGQQECQTVFTTDVYYTNPCSDEDDYIDDDILNTTISTESDYRIYYRTTPGETVNTNCNSILDIKRPIIIVEGFDIDETTTPELIYQYYFNDQGLGDALRYLGYDIIAFNLNYPFTHIGVNALVLANFIEFINNQKQTDEELIIMGVSMGGLVTRYALTYMEENNINHQTKLFISFDSPHEGAHVPISMQELTRELVMPTLLALIIINGLEDDLIKILELYNTLRSPAALEMNKYDLYKIENGYVYPADCYQTFHDELTNLNNCDGYPQNCKKIAIANGSINGHTQTGLDPTGNISGNPAIKFHIDPIYITRTLITVAGSDNPSVEGVCPLSYEVNCDKEGPYVKNYMDPIEHIPGGYYPWYGTLEEVVNSTPGATLDFIHLRNANFVPTISALDIFTNDQLLPISSYGKQVILDNCPFDDIWWHTGHYNLRHTDLTINISDFLDPQISGFSTSDNYCKYENLNLSNLTIPSGKRELYKASNNITINNTTVESGGKLTVKAGNSIIINSNLNIPAGSEFSLKAEPCNLASCKTEPPSLNATIEGDIWLEPNTCGNWTANPSGGTGNYTYKWYVDDIFRSASSNFSYCVYSEPYIDIELEVKSGLQTVNKYRRVDVIENPP